MKWIKITESLPVIKQHNWRSDDPVLFKTSKNAVFFGYYERKESREDGDYIGASISPKFVCEDACSDLSGFIFLDVKEWMPLPTRRAINAR